MKICVTLQIVKMITVTRQQDFAVNALMDIGITHVDKTVKLITAMNCCSAHSLKVQYAVIAWTEDGAGGVKMSVPILVMSLVEQKVAFAMLVLMDTGDLTAMIPAVVITAEAVGSIVACATNVNQDFGVIIVRKLAI